MNLVRRLLCILTAGYWLLIFTLTHLPAQRLPRPPFNLGDKACHSLAYFGLSMLIGLTIWTVAPNRRGWLWIILITGLSYGAIDEWLQIPVGRDCEFFDWVADSAGVMLAVLILSVFQRTVRNLIARLENNAPAATA